MDQMVEQDLTPRTEHESQAALRAVYDERRKAEDDALVEALTDRERLIIEQAWDRGAVEAREELSRRLASPHAVTLNADSVSRAVSGWRSTVEARRPLEWERRGGHHDERIVALVRYLKAVEESSR